ncbi:MAG TPA: ATP synthase F0 subunit B [Terriglobales bacterium]|nr:ATP synthase F0 subunit B [Terriglobales bacterium]
MRLVKGIVPLTLVLLALTTFGVAQEHKPADPQQPSEAQKSAEHAASPQAQPGPAEASKHAAGEEDENAQFRESPSVQFVARKTGLSLATAYWVCVGLNFAVIAALIVAGMKKALPAAFRERTASIQKAMEEARKASEDANRRLGDIESRLARLDQEIAVMRSSAEADARKEEERIQAAAEDDRKKVVQAAEQEIAAAARSARTQLKVYAAELAVGLAEQKISVGTDEDRELVRGFAERLGKDGK